MRQPFEGITLPSQWKRSSFKLLCKLNYGKSSQNVSAISGPYSIYGTGGKIGESNDCLYNGETIVIGRKGTLKNPIYVNEPIWVIDTAFYLSDFNQVNVRWLYYFLNSFDIAGYNESTGVPSLSRETLERIDILYCPPPDQQKIAEILTTVDNAIEKTETLIEKYKNIKQGLMQDLLTKGIDEHGNIRSEETHEFKDSPIGRIPKEWDVFSLKDVSVVRQGLQIAIAKRYNSPAINRYIYITVQYLNSDRKNTEYIQSPNPNMICTKDDILMTRTGNTGQVISDVEGVFHNNFFLIDYDRQLLNKDYLIYYLQKTEVQNFILGRAGVTTIPDLKHRDFYSIKINVPTLKEQERIVSILKAIDNNIYIETNSMGKLQSIKQGLMQDLLTGKVRVPLEEATG